jgi:hypothetical protein
MSIRRDQIMKCAVVLDRFDMLALTLFCLAVTFGETLCGAEGASPVPPVIQAGFDAYANKGPDAAIAAWCKGSYNEGEKSMSSGGDRFRSNERYFGKYESFELLATKAVGKRARLVFVAMCFDRGAMFARFQLYKRSSGWVIQDITWKYKPEELMPWLVGGRQQATDNEDRGDSP